MRVIKEQTLPSGLKSTLFSWNGKYILKIENGFLEQVYKINEMDVGGQIEIENLLTSPDFEKNVRDIFEKMESNLGPLW